MSWADPGERAVRFFNNLTHTGDYAGRPFKLRPWQEAPLRKLFGTIRPDGLRQYRKTFWALPRKQGKTEVVAGGGLYLLMGQGKARRRIYTASGDKEQASLIFKAAAEMVRADPALDSRLQLYEGDDPRIVYPAAGSELTVLSSVPKTKHGLGPTDVLIDELHVCDEELINVLTTGFGARREPLTWFITTAGDDRHSYCYDEWQYACKVRDGIIDDPTYLPVIYAADPEDNWEDERTWRKAMPALGDFCSIEFMRDEYRKAKERPRFARVFRQLYLNLWVEKSTRWLDMNRWAQCGRPLDRDSLVGRLCYAGLDLSQTRDLTAFVLIFPRPDGGIDVLCWFWAPADGVWKQETEASRLYPAWEESGHLTLSDGEVIDYTDVESTIVEVCRRYKPVMLNADPAMGWQLCQRLESTHGLTVRGQRQVPLLLNEPTRAVERLMLAGLLNHGANPVLTWNASNAAVKEQGTGLIQLHKAKSTGRIDGMAALVNAIAAWIATPEPTKKSVYESRGPRTC